MGRIVWFYARRYQAEQISKRRADAAREWDYHRWKKNGAMIHVGNPVEAGQIVPAMIVAVWGDKQPGSFLKGSGPDDTQRARTAPAAPGAREMRAVRLGFYFCLIKSFLSVAPKEKRL